MNLGTPEAGDQGVMVRKLTFVVLAAVVLLALVGCLPKINQPPVVTEVTAPATVAEGASFEVSAKASDPEGALAEVKFTFGSVTKNGVLDGDVYKATFTAPSVLADQDFTLTVTAYDDKGKASTPKTKSITVIANKAPVIVNLEAPSAVDEEKTFTATATVEDPNGLEDLDRVVFTFAGNDFVVATHTNGVFVGSITAPAVDENQTFVLSAKAYDKDGNESVPVTRDVQVINLFKPVVNEVKALGNFREGQTITVRATVTSSHPLNTTVTITVGEESKEAVRTVTGAKSVYEATFTLPLVDADEVIEISAQAYDAVNDQYSEFAYDYITVKNNEAPSVDISLPDSVEEDYAFTVTVSFSDPEGDSVVATVTYGGQTRNITDSDPSATFIAEEVDTDSVGVVTVEYVDEYTPDPAGGTKEATFLVLNDTDVPTVVATAATELYGGETLTVEWNATDSDGIAEVAITFDGIDLGPATGLAASGSKDFVIPATFDGTFTVYVKATEDGVAANPDTGEWSQVVTVLANDVPAVSATPLELTLDEGSTFTVTVTATDTIGGLDKIEVTGDALTAATTVDLGGATTTSQTITLTATSFDDAASKPLTFTVKVYDTYGLVSEKTGNVVVNDVNPAPSVAATVAAEVIGGTDFTVEWSATDTDGISAVDISFEGVTITSYSATEAAGSYTFTAPDVTADTPATLVVKVTDGKTVNPAEATEKYPFTVKPNLAPQATVVINTLAEYDNQKFNITVTATDDYGVATITFSGNVLATTTEIGVSGTTTTKNATLDPVDVVDATSVTGNIVVTVEDIYGKKWTWTSAPITVKDYNATPTVTATVSVTNVVEGDTFTVEWSATDPDGDGIAEVEISFAGITLDTFTATSATGSKTFTAPEVSADTPATVTVKAYDGRSYNQKSVTTQKALTVFNRPDITFTTKPSTGLEDNYVDFVVNVSDDDAIANISATLEDDAGNVVPATVTSTGTNDVVATLTFKLPYYPDANDHSATITVVATDSDSTNTAARTVTVPSTAFTVVNNPGAPSMVFDTVELWNNSVSLKRADWPEAAPIDDLNYYLKIKMDPDRTNVATLTYYFVDVTNPSISNAAASATVKDSNGDLLIDTFDQVFFTNDIPAGGAYYLVVEGQRPGKPTKYATATLADGSKYVVVVFNKNTPVTISDSTVTGIDGTFNSTPVIAAADNVFIATFTGVTKEPTFKLGDTIVSGAFTGNVVNGYYVGTTTLKATIDTTGLGLADGEYPLSLTAYYDIPGEVTNKAYAVSMVSPATVIVDNSTPVVEVVSVENYQTTATVTYKVIDVTLGSGEIGLLDLTSLSTQSAVLTTSAGTKVTFTLTEIADARTATVTLIATDVLGRAASVEYPFTADTKFATLLLDDFYANTHTINKDVTIEDLSTVTDATVSVTSAPGIATATIDTSGNLHIEVSTDTALTITITATDNAGNSDSATVQATVDTVAPAITATPNSNVAGPGDNLATVTVNDPGNVDTFSTLTFTIVDGTTTYSPIVTTENSTTLKAGNFITAVADRRTLTVAIKAEDYAGNSNTTSATVDFDNKFGSIALESAAPVASGKAATWSGVTITTDDSTVVATFNLTDLSTVSEIAIEVDPAAAGNATPTPGSFTPATSVSVEAVLDISGLSGGDVATFTVYATDSVGNSDTSYSIVVKKDEGTPTVAITDPSAGAVVTDDTFVATVDVSDVSLKEVGFLLEVEGMTPQSTIITPAQSLSQQPFSFYVGPKDLSNATLTLTATDMLGNASTTSWTGKIDNKFGTFSWETLPPTEVNIASSNVALTINATDLSGSFSVATGTTDNTNAVPSVATSTTGIATLTVTFGETQSKVVTITATGTDGNGNTAVLTWTFTLDTQRPSTSAVAINANNDYVLITFDEPVSVTGSGGVELWLYNPESYLAEATGVKVTQYSSNQIKADFSGIYDIQEGAQYKVVVKAGTVEDALGNTNVDVSATGTAANFAPSR